MSISDHLFLTKQYKLTADYLPTNVKKNFEMLCKNLVHSECILVFEFGRLKLALGAIYLDYKSGVVNLKPFSFFV